MKKKLTYTCVTTQENAILFLIGVQNLQISNPPKHALHSIIQNTH